MTLKPDAEELALIAEEIGAGVMRGPVRYPGTYLDEVTYNDKASI